MPVGDSDEFMSIIGDWHAIAQTNLYLSRRDVGAREITALEQGGCLASGYMENPMLIEHTFRVASHLCLPEHLQRLEDEAIYIFREAVEQARLPVLLYSIGKDSSVLLHLARKAFFPEKLPLPLLHVDTSWKFKEMYTFRDRIAASPGIDLRVYRNEQALSAGVNPFDMDSAQYTNVVKTQALKQALDLYGFDVVIGGARRDEEASRAKERIFSYRAEGHQWDPTRQRAEVWALYNGRKMPGEEIRVFPLSNWTELDVWEYIYYQQIEIPSLYFAKERSVVVRNGRLIAVDDDRMPIRASEAVEERYVRFRTLGCYPLTAAIESRASSVKDILLELSSARTSERVGRLIDNDEVGSMEKKKRQGYF